MRYKLIILVISCLLIGIHSSYAQLGILTPIETLKKTKEEILNHVKGNKNSDEKSFSLGLKPLLLRIFDTEETGKRSLGKNWKTLTEKQQKEFISLFSELLLRNYATRFKKIEETEIIFKKEVINENKATVETTTKTNGDSYSVIYKMHIITPKIGPESDFMDKWVVYDIVIENISLISTYRSEFNVIIESYGVSGLLTKLRDKIN